MTLTGEGRVAGVIGWPIDHSKSPQVHGYWLEHYQIDGAYVPLAVSPENLDAAIRGLPALGFRGANVTVPHKERALELVDHVDPTAKRIGAVNTIVVRDDGSLDGRNTDGFGFIENIREQRSDVDFSLGPAVVVGAGGAARAILAALIDEAAPEIRIANRTASRAEALAEEFGAPCRAVPWDQRSECLDGAALLVNTTTLGMTGQPPLALDLRALPSSAVVNDVVYVPLETPLLHTARTRGNPTVDGFGMLLHQARPGFAAWFGVMPDVTPELRRKIPGCAA